MSPTTSAADLLPAMPPFDTAFVSTVLDHRGASHPPSYADYGAAFEVLRRYYQQCLDNPREDDAWQPRVAEEGLAALRAKAFMMFGATKPTPAQWQKAHEALYGPLLHAAAE